jgi:hypothetical protein
MEGQIVEGKKESEARRTSFTRRWFGVGRRLPLIG